MGVQDLSKKIRPKVSSTNTTLHSLRKKYPQKNRIAIDASIISVAHIRSTPSAQSRMNYDPLVPVTTVVESFVKFLQPLVNEGFIPFLVFDGLTHPLKEDEHFRRYGDRDALANELETLYRSKGEKTFLLDDKKSLTRVFEIWKQLSSMKGHILYDVKDTLKKKFGPNIFFIGAPFEADHQLAALYHQGAVDFVYTKDSDVSVLGVDVITNIKKGGGCWVAMYSDLVSMRFPKLFKTCGDEDTKSINGFSIKVWTDELLRQCCCFLGNDYVDRSFGNGPTKVNHFLKDISNSDGSLRSKDIVSGAILKWTSMRDPDTKRIRQRNEEEQRIHLSKWEQAEKMFVHGPAFLIRPQSNISVRNIVTSVDGEYDIIIAPYKAFSRHDFTSWSDIDLGWDARDYFKCSISDELTRDIGDNSMNKIMKECYQLIRWKKGEVLRPLPFPEHSASVKSHHGSILNFNRIPINCFTTIDLKFWLACRQVSFVHCNDKDIPELVSKVWCTVGKDSPPIQIEMMRGTAGYVSPQVLIPNDGQQGVSWKRGDDFLDLLKSIEIELTEEQFTNFFGVRNGTRKRCLMHLENGSFDIRHFSATADLQCSNIGSDKTHIVFQALCSPSQRLKEKGKEKFYSCRLVAELSQNRKFCKFLDAPYRFCDCPNGCIWCAHCGGYVLALISITSLIQTNHELNFQDIIEKYPVPINEMLQAPILVKYVWPYLESDANLDRIKYNEESTTTAKSKSTIPANQSDTGYNLESPTNNIYDDVDEMVEEHNRLASDDNVTIFRIIQETEVFTERVKVNRMSDGSRKRTRKEWENMLEQHVKHKRSDEFVRKQLVVLERVEKVIKELGSNCTLRHTLEKTKSNDANNMDVDIFKYISDAHQQQPLSSQVPPDEDIFEIIDNDE